MSNKLVKEKRVDQADLAWLTDPEVYEVNTIPPHSDHESFQSQEELEDGQVQFSAVPGRELAD